ncbi:MAG: NAD(P)H-hydrate dehydratase [Gammaproteobacteria bacterium]|nr:NAD(P)H-hydrate dehydratase [Gammaproteobacteria bacterium]
MEARVYSVNQIRTLEKKAVEDYHISEFNLMLSAGRAAFNYLTTLWPMAKTVLVVCGSGNNGGDGFILAEAARESGRLVKVRILGDVEKLSATAKIALEYCQAHGINIQKFDENETIAADVIVDAILGIGLKKALEGSYAQAVSVLNRSHLPILALDVPTGINADSGNIWQSASGVTLAIKAEATITFIGYKQGLFTGAALDYCGKVALASLDLPAALFHNVAPSNEFLLPESIKYHLPPRPKNAHKGDCGHVLVMGGNIGMAGAARLAAEAALRVGAGLVSVATLAGHEAIVCAHYPEIMCHAVSSEEALLALLAKATVIILGPGLGTDEWAKMMFNAALTSRLPKIIDADGLNLLGKNPHCQRDWVLTPHPGEAGRLLGLDTKIIQSDRFVSVTKLAKLGGTWVLKGAGTLVRGNEDITFICPFGNPGMASGGMGDALSGIIGGLMAQNISCVEASKLGVLCHALAGDEVAKEGERGMVASDVIDKLRGLINNTE